MSQDDQKDLRRAAISNLDLNESTFSHFVKRVRDREAEVRRMVFYKLINDKIVLANL
jgi:hypothetical protein